MYSLKLHATVISPHPIVSTSFVALFIQPFYVFFASIFWFPIFWSLIKFIDDHRNHRLRYQNIHSICLFLFFSFNVSSIKILCFVSNEHKETKKQNEYFRSDVVRLLLTSLNTCISTYVYIFFITWWKQKTTVNASNRTGMCIERKERKKIDMPLITMSEQKFDAYEAQPLIQKLFASQQKEYKVQKKHEISMEHERMKRKNIVLLLLKSFRSFANIQNAIRERLVCPVQNR